MKTNKNVMKVKAVVTFFMVILLITFTACSGDDGAMGPQGERGEQGPQGPQGETGQDGAQGETGTANVIYSEWFDTQFSNNIEESSSNFTINAPQIDDAIINSGVVLVYAKRNVVTESGLAPQVYQLPFVIGGTRQQSYYFTYVEGKITIIVMANEEGEEVGAANFITQYRYVIIPGGTQVAGKSATATPKNSSKDYSKMSYEEIAKLFNIKD